ncbi:MAG: hypothetical protein B6I19_11360 [Bacteroidetes bacterium 4572_114]|nr:MAG: hypothetical protein B6I19_11360 [Bacteroidetes bacterium 4572_114]
MFKNYPTKNARIIWTGQVQGTDNIYSKTTHLCKQKVQSTEILCRRKYSGALHLNEVSDHLISINISRLRLPVRRTLWLAGHSETADRSAAERVLQEDDRNFINQNQPQHIKIIFSLVSGV